MQGFTTQRCIYDYFARHWRHWFPALPSYQAFNRRLHQLTPAFELFIESNLCAAGKSENLATADRLIDSLPVMLAQDSRANRARVARQLADVGFCGLFGDKAYADTDLKTVLRERRVYLTTPYKRKRNEDETVVPRLLSRFVSRIRQPIESLFGWMIQRTPLNANNGT